MGVKLTAETFIKCDSETLWRYTQTPEMHVRWDLRFTDIGMLTDGSDGKPKRFRYATRIGFGKTIEGWGETVGDGNTSALKFGSDDFKSLIVEGAGSWLYRPANGGMHFSTIYDYSTRYGAAGTLFDSIIFRPMMIWATRWSFDRLRIWIERGVAPEKLLWIWLAKFLARTILGGVCIYAGLLRLVLVANHADSNLVLHSGMLAADPFGSPRLIGIGEILFGLWLISGRAEKIITILFMVALVAWIAVNNAEALAKPFPTVANCLALLGCVAVVLLFSDQAPSANQKHPPS